MPKPLARLTQLNKITLADQAAAKLRNLILRGTLPAGSPVTEEGIGAQIGISRTPAREAIRILASEGLIKVSETGRLSIADPDLNAVINLMQVLRALEDLACGLAALNASSEELTAIEQYHFRMRDLADDASKFRYIDADIAFHRAIVAASGNSQLERSHRVIDDQLYRARYLASQRPEHRQVAIVEHAAIVDALLKRDWNAAHQAMGMHLETTTCNLRGSPAEKMTAEAR